MYHTPAGDRILLGAERRFFTQSLAMVVDLLTDGDADFDIIPFGELQWNQKVHVLYQVARALLLPNEPMPKLTAYNESALACVYDFAKDQLCEELGEPEQFVVAVSWRHLILDALRDRLAPDELPDESDDDAETWIGWIECLEGNVLWDNDYETQLGLDLPPEESRQLRSVIGIDDDYFTDVPPDPPDAEVRRYLKALIDLTSDAR